MPDAGGRFFQELFERFGVLRMQAFHGAATSGSGLNRPAIERNIRVLAVPVLEMPPVTEMLTLFLARQLLAPLAGTQLGDGLGTALDKIKAILPKRTLDYFAGFADTLLVKSVGHPDYAGHDKEIRILNQAIDEDRVARIRYKSASRGRVQDVHYHPYGLVFLGTNWDIKREPGALRRRPVMARHARRIAHCFLPAEP